MAATHRSYHSAKTQDKKCKESGEPTPSNILSLSHKSTEKQLKKSLATGVAMQASSSILDEIKSSSVLQS